MGASLPVMMVLTATTVSPGELMPPPLDEAAVAEVIAANPDKVLQAQEKPALAGWFVGQVMKATGGKANPQAVNAIVREKLGIA